MTFHVGDIVKKTSGDPNQKYIIVALRPEFTEYDVKVYPTTTETATFTFKESELQLAS